MKINDSSEYHVEKNISINGIEPDFLIMIYFFNPTIPFYLF